MRSDKNWSKVPILYKIGCSDWSIQKSFVYYNFYTLRNPKVLQAWISKKVGKVEHLHLITNQIYNCVEIQYKQQQSKSCVDGWMGGWLDRWAEGRQSQFRDCLLQSKNVLAK